MGDVVINFDLSEKHKKELKENFKKQSFIFINSASDIKLSLKNAEVLITIQCTEDMVNSAPELKWIQSIRAGVDSWPLEKIHGRNIIVTNGRGVHKVHMAEYAIAAMINLARNFHVSFRNQIKGQWFQGVEQGEIYGSTVGILGLGSIGQEIAKRASLFGMRVIGTKNQVSPVEFVEKVYDKHEMEEVFKESDYIINLLPHTEDTEKIIDEKYFNIMKSSSCFINIGRGKTVNEKHLVSALENKRIKAAVLDVFYEEPLLKDNPLWGLENVMITPHTCGESVKYIDKAMEIIKYNLKAYSEDKGEMINVVDLKRGY